MGQAHRRGSFEERRTQSIARMKTEFEARVTAEIHRLQALTPEERRAEARRDATAKLALTIMLGMASGAVKMREPPTEPDEIEKMMDA